MKLGQIITIKLPNRELRLRVKAIETQWAYEERQLWRYLKRDEPRVIN